MDSLDKGVSLNFLIVTTGIVLFVGTIAYFMVAHERTRVEGGYAWVRYNGPTSSRVCITPNPKGEKK